MKNTSLFSATGLVSIAVFMLLSVLVISLLPSVRIDLTEDNLYSLSDGTRNIVSNLKKPIEMIFFYSDEATQDVPQIRSYATRVRELLREIVLASNGNLTFNVVDPEPFSEEEDLAAGFGMRAVPITQGGEAVYFGLVVAEATENGAGPVAGRVSETIPLIRPDQEEFLEYEIMKLITQVETPDRQVVGLLTELEVDGGFNQSVGQPTSPWMVMDIIRQLYEIRRIDIASGEIDEEIDILFIVHPEGLSDQMLYAIDQHILRNGKAIVFLDPNAESMIERSQYGNMVPAGMASDLPGLLAAWGVSYDSSKVLTDNDFALSVMLGQGSRPVAHLAMLGVPRAGLTTDDVITSRLESINISSAGAVSKAEGASTTFEPLILSSSNAMLMQGTLVRDITDPSVLFDEFESENQNYIIAARISGAVNTAFAEGAPVVEETETDETEGSTDGTDENATPDVVEAEEEEEIETAEPREHLASSSGDVNIVIVADTDLLGDRLWVQVSQFLGQRIPQPFANNGDFVVNALDNLSGGADLVSIRSRGVYSRPFTRVIELQREAGDRLREQESELMDSLAETQETLGRLSQGEDGEPILQITSEVQQEIDRVNAQILNTRRNLRDVQYQLNADIERLGTTLKVANTILIPFLLTVLMLVLSYLRAKRRKQHSATAA